jgi:hypothetical protein
MSSSGRYEKVREIGRGTSGKVFLVHNVQGTLLAIKGTGGKTNALPRDALNF